MLDLSNTLDHTRRRSLADKGVSEGTVMLDVANIIPAQSVTPLLCDKRTALADLPKYQGRPSQWRAQ